MKEKAQKVERLLALAFALMFFAGPAQGMSFNAVTWNGHEALLATGAITAGSSDRLRRALEEVAPARHGARIILLDSPGGSVGEALAMSDMLRAYQTHMVIPDGATCASACASILFVAGTYRTVEPGGLFGQHSCSHEGAVDAACNEAISMHAFSRGVSHGSINMFITNVPPDEILWFSREDVDCWGISRYPFSSQSGFQKSEPCAIRGLLGYTPPAQAAWRMDFISNGYRAFLRPYVDHERELELSLFCNEAQPGLLFLTMDIAGQAELIESAILSASLFAPPVVLFQTPFVVFQVDARYSRVMIMIATEHVVPLLRRTTDFLFLLDLRPPFETISARTTLASSRDALIFAANNCMDTR